MQLTNVLCSKYLSSETKFSNQKSNLYFTRDITPKCVTSGEAHLSGSAWATQKHRSGGEPLTTVFDLTDQVIEAKTSRASCGISNHYATDRYVQAKTVKA